MAYGQPPLSTSRRHTRARGGEPDFRVEDFLKLTASQRVRLCTEAAERAHMRASEAAEPHKCSYLAIAREWLVLAEAILKEETERRENAARIS